MESADQSQKGFEPNEEQAALISKFLNNNCTILDPQYGNTHVCLTQK